MKPKEKAIEYLNKHFYITKDVARIFINQSIDIALQQQAKDIFKDIEKEGGKPIRVKFYPMKQGFTHKRKKNLPDYMKKIKNKYLGDEK